MSIRKGLWLAAVCASALTYGGGARAEEGKEAGIVLPVSYVERGITNPQGILSPVVDIGLGHEGGAVPGTPPIIPIPGVAPGSTALGFQLTAGAGYAITNDIGVRATVIAAQFNGPASFFGPSIGGTYRFLKGEFELGAALDIGFSTVSGAGGAAFVPSAPMRLHIGKLARLDVQPGFTISTPGTTLVGLSIPVAFAIDIIEPLHVGVQSGYGMIFNPPARVPVGDTVFIPVGLFAGYAIAGPKGPVLDLDPFFTWPGLFFPGLSNNAVQSGAYAFGLEATYYLYL